MTCADNLIQIADKLLPLFTHTCLDYNRLNVLATIGSMSWLQQAVSQLPDDAQPLIIVALDPIPYIVDEQQDVTTAADTAAMRKAPRLSNPMPPSPGPAEGPRPHGGGGRCPQSPF